MNTSYLAMIITLLSIVLPKIGVQVGSEELTTTATTIISIVGALVALIHTKTSQNLTILGKAKAE